MRLPRPVALVGVADLADGAHGHLCRETELLADVTVVETMQLELVGCPSLESAFRQPLAGGVDALHGGEQGRGLFVRGKQLSYGNELHCLEYITPSKNLQPVQERAFLCQLKQAVSGPKIA